MRSVADDLRDDTRRQTAALTPDGRVRLALELGDADVAALASARQVSVEQARVLIARSRRDGWHPSQAHGD